MKNQLLAKNFDIQPVDVSNISATRPFRSIFPNPVYVTKTKVDENLVQVDEDDQTSRASDFSSSYTNTQNQFAKNEAFQFSATSGQYNSNNQLGSAFNQTPYQYEDKNVHNVTNFTPLSNNLPVGHNFSNQNSPHPANPDSRSKLTQG